MRIEPFKCLIKSVSYYSNDSDAFGKQNFYGKCFCEAYEDCKGNAINDEDEKVFFAKVSAIEQKKGKCRVKYSTIYFYLTEEEYNNQVLHEGDIVSVTNAKLNTYSYNLEIRNKDKLKGVAKRYIKKDANGYTFAKFKIEECVLSVPIGKWEVFVEQGQEFYFKIEGVTFYCETKDELLEEEKLTYGLEDNEYETLKDFDGCTETISCYVRKQLKEKFECELKVYYDEDAQCGIIEINRKQKI